jgi:DNA repair protein RadD
MEPRHYQQEAHDAAWMYLSSQPGEPLIVLPTGSGKSLVIAMLVEQARKFDARVIVLQHRKELIEQNAEKVGILLPDIKVGKNSAGLRSRSFDDDVICAGIQSVYSKAHEFGRRELIIIDEVHLVGGSDDSMYGQFLKEIREANPKARMVGLTATPFRTGEGPICGPSKLFQRVCYEAFTGDLIKEGFLCPITNRPASSSVDTSGIRKNKNEFSGTEMAKSFDTSSNVSMACSEIVEKCHDRNSVLCFASGVDHADHIAEVLRSLTGDKVGVVTGETFPMERSRLLHDFKTGSLRWLVNCDVLTTGFDAPCIDVIAILRATMSPGLFAQIVGRGLRKHDSKTDCLVLDFGENIKRHGSIDNPEFGRVTPGKGNGKSSSSVSDNGRGCECYNCGLDVSSRFSQCPECGFIFPVNHDSTADEDSALTGEPDREEWDVVSCSWSVHTKRNAPDGAPRTLRIDYAVKPVGAPDGNLTNEKFSEWVCIEHSGFARVKALQWWNGHSHHDPPTTSQEAVEFLDRHVARMPSKITTQQDGKFQRVTSCEFKDEIPDKSEYLEHSGVVGSLPGDDFNEDDVPF